MSRASRGLVLGVLVVLASPARAQVATTVLDSARAEGRRDAQRPAVWHRGLIGFVGGIPMGFSLPLAVTGPAVLIPVGIGYATVMAAAEGGSALPTASHVAGIAARGPEYVQAYSKAYDDRLQRRRRKAAWTGAAVGGGVGLGLLAALAIQLSKTDF